MEEGVTWIGANEDANDTEGLYHYWYKWHTNSDSPCSVCESRDNTYSRNKRPKPHPHCNCFQIGEDMRTDLCSFKERSEKAMQTDIVYIYIGDLSAHSKRTFSFSKKKETSVKSSNEGISSTDSITMENNDDEPLRLFEVYEIQTVDYIDTYVCVGIVSDDKIIEMPVQRKEVKFITIQTRKY